MEPGTRLALEHRAPSPLFEYPKFPIIRFRPKLDDSVPNPVSACWYQIRFGPVIHYQSWNLLWTRFISGTVRRAHPVISSSAMALK
jgi:hypothetical protein